MLSVGTFPFDIRLIIKAQLMENLKFLRTLYFFLTETQTLQVGYSGFQSRCKALNVKLETGSFQLYMEDYLVKKTNTTHQNYQIAQPLTLIPEIAEIDKISDRAVREDNSSKKNRLISKVPDKINKNGSKTGQYKFPHDSILSNFNKANFTTKASSPEKDDLKLLKNIVVEKLESKWGLIKKIEDIQKKDDKALEILTKIDVELLGTVFKVSEF